MDRSTSLQMYPDEMEILGDRVTMNMFYEKPPFKTFKTQISRSVHIPGDPRLDFLQVCQKGFNQHFHQRNRMYASSFRRRPKTDMQPKVQCIQE